MHIHGLLLPGLTLAARERVVPLPVGSVQTCQNRVSDQNVTRVTLKGDGLAGAVVIVDDVTVGEWEGILAALELIGWRQR